MALIDTFKDRFGRFIYPKTVPKAIIDPDTGESLDKFFDRDLIKINAKQLALPNGTTEIEVERNTPLSVVSLEGREPIVNLMGKGKTLDSANFFSYQAGISGTVVVDEEGSSIKFTATATYKRAYKAISVKPNAYYIAYLRGKKHSGVGRYGLITRESSVSGSILAQHYKDNTDYNSFTWNAFVPTQNTIAVGVEVNNIDTTFSINKIQLVEVTQQEYTDFQAGTLTIENLLERYPYVDGIEFPTNPKVTSAGKNLIGKVEQGSLNSSTGQPHINPDPSRIRSGEYIGVKPATQYTLSSINLKSQVDVEQIIMQYDKNKDFLSTTGWTGNPLSIMLGNNTTYVKLIFRLTDESNLAISDINIQLEEGRNPTSYAMYQGHEILIAAEMCKLPNGTKDEVKDGKLAKRIGKKVLLLNDTTAMYTGYSTVDIALVKKPIDSTIYNLTTYNTNDFLFGSHKIIPSGGLNGVEFIGAVSNAFNRESFAVIFPKGTTLEQAQAELAGTEVYYELIEEIITPVEVHGITLKEDTNHITVTQENNVSIPQITVEYEENLRGIVEKHSEQLDHIFAGGADVEQVIESNLGTAIRYKNGWQVCITTCELKYQDGLILSHTWNFPALFSHKPFVFVNKHTTASTTTLATSVPAASFDGLGSSLLRLFAISGNIWTTSSKATVVVYAIGRWK